MKLFSYALVTFGIALICGYTISVSAAALAVGIVYNPDGTCSITLPSSTVSGTTTIDTLGQQSCSTGASTSATTQKLTTYFAATFPAPSLLFLVNGGSRATVQTGDAVTLSWQAMNIAPKSCTGITSIVSQTWNNTFKEPIQAMDLNIPVTYTEVISAGATDQKYVLHGCTGTDGTILPDASVLVLISNTTATQDTTTVQDTTQKNTGTTPPTPKRAILWKEN